MHVTGPEVSTVPASKDDAALARAAAQRLARLARPGAPLTLRIGDVRREETIELPAGAVRLLMEILGGLSSGQAVTVVSQSAELTTQQAADCLNVSRPFLIQLLDEKQIPYRWVGTHRRVHVEDVLRYKQRIDSERRKALDELAAEAQALDLGY
jgi:excisionase family DNA binding protein